MLLLVFSLLFVAHSDGKSSTNDNPSCMSAVQSPLITLCVSNPAGLPTSVSKKIGSKGGFLKKYYALGESCFAAQKMDSCRPGCYSSKQMDCQPPSVYQYFACPGSLAWQFYNCPTFSNMGMACPKGCLTDGKSCFGKPIPPAMSKLLFTGANGIVVTHPNDEELIPTANFALWQKAYGTCSSSKYLFNRQVCTNVPDKTIGKIACLKFKHCEWGKAGCQRKKSATAAALFKGDSALAKWESRCNGFKGKSCYDAVFK